MNTARALYVVEPTLKFVKINFIYAHLELLVIICLVCRGGASYTYTCLLYGVLILAYLFSYAGICSLECQHISILLSSDSSVWCLLAQSKWMPRNLRNLNIDTISGSLVECLVSMHNAHQMLQTKSCACLKLLQLNNITESLMIRSTPHTFDFWSLIISASHYAAVMTSKRFSTSHGKHTILPPSHLVIFCSSQAFKCSPEKRNNYVMFVDHSQSKLNPLIRIHIWLTYFSTRNLNILNGKYIPVIYTRSSAMKWEKGPGLDGCSPASPR